MSYVPQQLAFLAFLYGIGLNQACAPATNTDSASNAYVSASTLKKAGETAAKIDYLPTTYVQDNCYIRSVYVSMELAAANIPSSAQIVSTCHSNRDADDLLKLPDGTTWNWHVAFGLCRADKHL